MKRLDDAVKRIRVAPAYTEEIGALLGILTNTQPLAPIGSTPPVIKAIAQPGNLIEVSFVRGPSSGVLLQTQIDNEGTFADAGRFFRSPAELAIPPGDKPLPRSVEIRARFLDGNTPVGSWSQVETIATMP